MTTISMDKKYTTRNGFPVTILSINVRDSTHKVVGLIHYRDYDAVQRWTMYGNSRLADTREGVDLVEFKEKKKAFVVCCVTKTGELELYSRFDSVQEAEYEMPEYKQAFPESRWFIHEIEYEV